MRRFCLIGCAILLLLTGCGGGSSGGGSSGPGVSSVTPTDGAVGVERNVAITATFDTLISIGTVDTNSFTLTGNAPVDGTVTFDGPGNAAIFTPAGDLALLTTYSATLTTAITSFNGQPLAGDYLWAFTTRDGTWGTAGLIEASAGDAFAPKVAFDGNGNAIAVWYQSDGVRLNIWANRFDALTGWGTAELLEIGNAGVAQVPEIAMDADGNAIAIWTQNDGLRYNIVANRYDALTGWGTAELVETDNTGPAGLPAIDSDADGNAVAVWTQNDGIRNNIWANRYDVIAGWGVPELIEVDNAGAASSPRIAVNGNGNAVAVWFQSDGIRTNIWANRYDTVTGWGVAEMIEFDNAGDAYDQQVSVDASGNAVAVWRQFDGAGRHLWANRYDLAAGWGTPELIETGAVGDVGPPQVAMDAAGNVVTVWGQLDAAGGNISINRYDVGSGWGTARVISANPVPAGFPHISIDASGNALVLWQQHDGTRFNVVAARYEASGVWNSATLIELDNAGDATHPVVATDSLGNAIAVWQQSDGSNINIVANRFE